MLGHAEPEVPPGPKGKATKLWKVQVDSDFETRYIEVRAEQRKQPNSLKDKEKIGVIYSQEAPLYKTMDF